MKKIKFISKTSDKREIFHAVIIFSADVDTFWETDVRLQLLYLVEITPPSYNQDKG